MKKIEFVTIIVAVSIFCISCVGLVASFLLSLNGYLEIICEKTGMDVGGGDVFSSLLLSASISLYLIYIPETVKIFLNGTWLFRVLLICLTTSIVCVNLPSFNWTFEIVLFFAVIIQAKEKFEKSDPCRMTKLWFRMRHLLFKGYVWEKMPHAELVLYKLKYGPYMSTEEMNAITELVQVNNGSKPNH